MGAVSRDVWQPVLIAVVAASVGALVRHLLLRGERQQMAKQRQNQVTPRRGPIVREISELRGPVQEPLRRVLAAMEARGLEPRVFETRRSEARAHWLARKGTGIVKSTHRLGLAADVIDKNKLWGASPEFWRALREEAEREGFVSLAPADRPHIQAIAVSEQPQAWKLAEQGDDEGLDQLAAASLASRRGAEVPRV